MLISHNVHKRMIFKWFFLPDLKQHMLRLGGIFYLYNKVSHSISHFPAYCHDTTTKWMYIKYVVEDLTLNSLLFTLYWIYECAVSILTSHHLISLPRHAFIQIFFILCLHRGIECEGNICTELLSLSWYENGKNTLLISVEQTKKCASIPRKDDEKMMENREKFMVV